MSSSNELWTDSAVVNLVEELNNPLLYYQLSIEIVHWRPDYKDKAAPLHPSDSISVLIRFWFFVVCVCVFSRLPSLSYSSLIVLLVKNTCSWLMVLYFFSTNYTVELFIVCFTGSFKNKSGLIQKLLLWLNKQNMLLLYAWDLLSTRGQCFTANNEKPHEIGRPYQFFFSWVKHLLLIYYSTHVYIAVTIFQVISILCKYHLICIRIKWIKHCKLSCFILSTL